MIKGIGVDMVSISQIQRFMENFSESVLRRIYSEDEIAASRLSSEPAARLAGIFGVKEAVFKAVAHLTLEKNFDLRIVESLNRPDGYPYVKVNKKLKKVLDEANIKDIYISITTENDYAVAVAVAEGDTGIVSCI